MIVRRGRSTPAKITGWRKISEKQTEHSQQEVTLTAILKNQWKQIDHV